MKKLIALAVAALIALQCCAFAAGLRYRNYWLPLHALSTEFRHEELISQLTELHAEHPKLMDDNAFAHLRALGEECLELEKYFEREEDIFEGVIFMWPSEIERPGTDEPFAPYIRHGDVVFDISIAGNDYFSLEKMIFVSDTGKRVSKSVKLSERETFLDDEGRCVEKRTVRLGYEDWDGLILDEDARQITVRYYSIKGKTLDYTLTDAEFNAFRTALTLTNAAAHLRDELRKWCESIEKVDE